VVNEKKGNRSQHILLNTTWFVSM